MSFLKETLVYFKNNVNIRNKIDSGTKQRISLWVEWQSFVEILIIPIDAIPSIKDIGRFRSLKSIYLLPPIAKTTPCQKNKNCHTINPNVYVKSMGFSRSLISSGFVGGNRVIYDKLRLNRLQQQNGDIVATISMFKIQIQNLYHGDVTMHYIYNNNVHNMLDISGNTKWKGYFLHNVGKGDVYLNESNIGVLGAIAFWANYYGNTLKKNTLVISNAQYTIIPLLQYTTTNTMVNLNNKLDMYPRAIPDNFVYLHNPQLNMTINLMEWYFYLNGVIGDGMSVEAYGVLAEMRGIGYNLGFYGLPLYHKTKPNLIDLIPSDFATRLRTVMSNRDQINRFNIPTISTFLYTQLQHVYNKYTHDIIGTSTVNEMVAFINSDVVNGLFLPKGCDNAEGCISLDSLEAQKKIIAELKNQLAQTAENGQHAPISDIINNTYQIVLLREYNVHTTKEKSPIYTQNSVFNAIITLREKLLRYRSVLRVHTPQRIRISLNQIFYHRTQWILSLNLLIQLYTISTKTVDFRDTVQSKRVYFEGMIKQLRNKTIYL